MIWSYTVHEELGLNCPWKHIRGCGKCWSTVRCYGDLVGQCIRQHGRRWRNIKSNENELGEEKEKRSLGNVFKMTWRRPWVMKKARIRTPSRGLFHGWENRRPWVKGEVVDVGGRNSRLQFTVEKEVVQSTERKWLAEKVIKATRNPCWVGCTV